MCGRVVWVWDPKTGRLLAKYVDEGLDDPDTVRVLENQRYNVPPSSHLPVIEGVGGRRQITIARWGFPLPQNPTGVFNTRIESVEGSDMWKSLFGSHHGVVVVKGFYEWRRAGPSKTPYFIQRTDGEPMILAGLVGRRTIAGTPRPCVSILTCPPNEAMKGIHDRMPVILEQRHVQAWLDPTATGIKTLRSLAVPAGDILDIYAVDAAVNSTDSDHAGLLARRGQTTLF